MADNFNIPWGRWGQVPASEIESRIAQVQKAMARVGMDAAVILQKADLYYLTGTIQQGHLLLPTEGEPVLFVSKDFDRARYESPLEQVRKSTNLQDLPAAIAALGLAPTCVLGMELDVVPVAVFRRYETLMPQANIRDCSPLIRDIRSVKSAYEQGLIAEAAAMVDLGVKAAATVLREGMTEVELSAHCEFALRAAGHQGIARLRAFGQEWACGHVFAGAGATIPAYASYPLGGAGVSAAVGQGSGWRPIGRNEPVIIDIVACAAGYLCDQTRIMSLGPLPSDMVEAYELCLETQELIRQAAVVGAVPADVYDEAAAWINEAVQDSGLDAYFMGAPDNQVPFIGHGIGLELDEPPFITWGLRQALRENQILALEPKLVFPGRGAVGIENTWRVTPEGLVSLNVSDETRLEL